MTCFDRLFKLQFDDEYFNEFVDNYYIWYEDRVNEVLNERGIAKATVQPDHPKSDIIRAIRHNYRYNYYTVCNALDSIQQYCRDMDVECRLSPSSFGMLLAERYYEEHEVPFLYRGENQTINFSKSIDFVSWTALTTVFQYMYGNGTSLIRYMGSDTRVIISIYDDFIAPELIRVKPYARIDIFNAFTDWVAETFEDVMIEKECVTFGGNILCNSTKH